MIDMMAGRTFEFSPSFYLLRLYRVHPMAASIAAATSEAVTIARGVTYLPGTRL